MMELVEAGPASTATKGSTVSSGRQEMMGQSGGGAATLEEQRAAFIKGFGSPSTSSSSLPVIDVEEVGPDGEGEDGDDEGDDEGESEAQTDGGESKRKKRVKPTKKKSKKRSE